MRNGWLLLLFACGGNVESNPDGSADASTSDVKPKRDSGVIVDADNGEASDVYPVPHPPLPQLVNQGGPVMTAPKVVPIFYAEDSMRAKLESFLAAIPGTSYWSQTTSEYGVGAITIAPSIVIPDAAPVTIEDKDIEKWLGQMITQTGSTWPKPDGNTIYMIFYPQKTTPTYDKIGKACLDFYSYHLEAPLDTGDTAIYAVVPRCSKLLFMTGQDVITARASHDLIGAATNPYPLSKPAWSMPDDDHFTWVIFPGSQIGAMCAWERQNYQRFISPYMEQKAWSNMSAGGGHDPCVPLETGKVYFNAAPVLNDTVSLTGGGWGQKTTKGVKIPVGQEKTIDVIMWSDGPMAPWSVQAMDVEAQLNGTTPKLEFIWDRTQGQNGEKLHLTIKAIATGSYGGSEFLIWSTLGQETHTSFGFVGN